MNDLSYKLREKEMPEEFNNFMHRVTEVSQIVKKLSSTDKDLQEIGILEADQYLGHEHQDFFVDEDQIKLRCKSDRSVINHAACRKADDGTQSQEAFMAEVSRDAERRAKDKEVRMEKMETFKKQATKAFRHQDYTKALNYYNKAIEQIRDSPLLYNNRCLTYINLHLFSNAIEDAQMALKLNDGCLRSYLLLAKAYLFNGDQDEYESAIEKAKNASEVDMDFIEDFAAKLRNLSEADGDGAVPVPPGIIEKGTSL